MKNIILLLSLITLISAQELSCKDKAHNTYELMDCQKIEIKQYESVMQRYLLKSIERFKDKKELIPLMEKSQKYWLAYRKLECSAIYKQWVEGSIRGLMHGQCLIDMTKRRTHEIWENYLTYIDSTPVVLAEPK